MASSIMLIFRFRIKNHNHADVGYSIRRLQCEHSDTVWNKAYYGSQVSISPYVDFDVGINTTQVIHGGFFMRQGLQTVPLQEWNLFNIKQ